MPPWTLRERQWDDARKAAPDGCPVKGETRGSERRYHLPWNDSYGRVKVTKNDIGRGTKQWFCTEAEARAAGHTPAAIERR